MSPVHSARRSGRRGSRDSRSNGAGSVDVGRERYAVGKERQDQAAVGEGGGELLLQCPIFRPVACRRPARG